MIFCCDLPFPRGNAGANRVYYLAKALVAAGREVLVLARNANGMNEICAEYGNVAYFGLPTRHGKLGKLLDEKILNGHNMVRLLQRLPLVGNEIVCIYANSAIFVLPVMKYCMKRKIKTVIDVVEWHQASQYKWGRLSLRFGILNYTFERLAPQIGNIIAISKCINNHFTRLGCHTTIIPPLTDISEVSFAPKNGQKKTFDLIYPGIPYTKDDIEVMLHSILLLPLECRKKVCFHSTGISEKSLRQFLGKRQWLLDELQDVFHVHGFMPFAELELLYKNVDFLLLARYDNLVDRANFPSKLPELMARGIIPIGNRIGDYYTYLDDGFNAFLYDKISPVECSKAILRAVLTPLQQLSAMKDAARECARSKFDYRGWKQRVSDFLL